MVATWKALSGEFSYKGSGHVSLRKVVATLHSTWHSRSG